MSGAQPSEPGDDEEFGDLFDQLEELEETVDSPAEREQVRAAMRLATEAQDDDPAVFGRVVWGFGREDLAEAALGALLFGIPMAVEGGTLDAGVFLAAHPLLLVANLAAAVTTVVGILYVADIQDVRVANAILGVVPRRLVGVTGSAFLLAVGLLTGWGMVSWSTDPAVVWRSFCVCSVAFIPMAIGAALGDILPGS